MSLDVISLDGVEYVKKGGTNGYWLQRALYVRCGRLQELFSGQFHKRKICIC